MDMLTIHREATAAAKAAADQLYAQMGGDQLTPWEADQLQYDGQVDVESLEDMENQLAADRRLPDLDP